MREAVQLGRNDCRKERIYLEQGTLSVKFNGSLKYTRKQEPENTKPGGPLVSIWPAMECQAKFVRR